MTDLLHNGVQTAADLRTLLEKYLPLYLPAVTNVDPAGDGRKFFNLVASLVRTMHFGLDFRFRQSNPVDVDRLAQAVKVFAAVGYQSPGPSAASATERFTNLTGAVTGAPVVIAQYTELKTTLAPTRYAVTAAAASIPVGSSAVDVGILQGRYATGQTVAAAASGGPYQAYRVTTRYLPRDYVAVYVNAVAIPRYATLNTADDTTLCWQAVYDADGYLYVTFGDGIFGKCPDAGAAITADWLQSDGADGNFTLAENQFSVLTGSLKNTLSAQQLTASTGGSNGPDVDTVKRTAPGLWAATGYVRNAADAEARANDFPGVYRTRVTRPGGSVLRVYVMPDGGGTASPLLLAAVLADLQGAAVAGLMIETYSLVPVPLLAAGRVVLQEGQSRTPRAAASKAILAALEAALDYTQVEIGRGYKVSDLTALIENLHDGQLTDYVDLSRFTREPRVVASNPLSPTIHSFTVDPDLVVSSTWTVIRYDNTRYFVAQDGVLTGTLGTIGSVYAAAGFSFIVGVPGDTFTVGDTYTIYSSRYNGNISLQPDEYMYYRQDTDFAFDIVYAEEDV